jgi:ABC-type ATPase involved in cell division
MNLGLEEKVVIFIEGASGISRSTVIKLAKEVANELFS